MSHQMHDTIAKIFPSGIGSIIVNVLEQAEVVSNIMDAFAKRHPSHQAEIDDAFLSLSPPPTLMDKDPKLFRHHVLELLERVVGGDKLEWGSKAEVLSALSAASLKAPLSQDYASLMEQLFLEVFGQLPTGGTPAPESYDGARDEILNTMRKQLRQERTV